MTALFVTDLLSEQILLVQEQEHGGVDKESVVANLLKQIDSLHHTVTSPIPRG